MARTKALRCKADARPKLVIQQSRHVLLLVLVRQLYVRTAQHEVDRLVSDAHLAARAQVPREVAAMVMLFGLARLTARQIEKASPFYN